MELNHGHPLAWHETLPGHWERPLKGMEVFFVRIGQLKSHLCDNKPNLAISSSIKLAQPLPINPEKLEDAIRQAWIHLRFQQPSLAIRADSKRLIMEYDTVIGRETLSRWAQETFHVIPNASSAQSYFPSFAAATVPMLYYFSSSREIVFRAPHWAIDGMGTLRLWRTLLQLLSEPPTIDYTDWGTEAKRLAPHYEQIWGFGMEEESDLAEEAEEILTKWLTNLPGVGPASSIATDPPGKCARLKETLDESETAAVIANCKTLKTTVTSAVHAAFALACSGEDICDPQLSSRGLSIIPSYDLRPYLPAPYNSDEFAVAVYYTPWFLYLSLKDNFSDLCTQLHQIYHTTLKGQSEKTASSY